MKKISFILIFAFINAAYCEEIASNEMSYKKFFHSIASKITVGSVVKITHIPNYLTSRVPLDINSARRIGLEYGECYITVKEQMAVDLSNSVEGIKFNPHANEPNVRWIFDFYEGNSKIKRSLYFSGDGSNDIGNIVKSGQKNAMPIIIIDKSILLDLKNLYDQHCQ